jgi:hypothetical protein
MFNLQYVTNHRLRHHGRSSDFSASSYGNELDTICILSLDPPREKLYRVKKRFLMRASCS